MRGSRSTVGIRARRRGHVAKTKISGMWWWVAVAEGIIQTSPLHRLLLQRSVQTQVVYLTEFHDEVKASWLAEFGAPCAPMEAVRLGRRECRPKYHGLDGMASRHGMDYLRTMMSSKPIEYKVKYVIGRPEAPDDEVASAAMEMWGTSAAAASRRKNPYLQQTRYIEYDETIHPFRCADLLMRTMKQIALEWETDLRAIPALDHLRAETDFGVETAYASAVRAMPISATFEDAASSPLRAASLDLCERLATRDAAKRVIEGSSGGVATWLSERLELDGDDEDALQCRVLQVDALSGHARKRGLAVRWLRDLTSSPPPSIDASKVVDAILAERKKVAIEWASSIVADVHAYHTDLYRICLQKMEDLVA